MNAGTRLVFAAQAVLLLFVIQPTCLGQTQAWIAFRYDSTHVLLYVCEANDSQPLPASLADPVARWGLGGYLKSPHPDLLEQEACKQTLQKLQTNERITLRVGPSKELHALVEKCVEQYDVENPVVRIGVIAMVQPSDVAAYRSVKADYFLAYKSALPQIGQNADEPFMKSRQPEFLNDLGKIGKIVQFSGDAGWVVVLTHTGIRYAYGD